MYPRSLNTSKSNSFFIFGARGTGKTTYLRETFTEVDAYRIDLLDQSVLAELDARPERLAGIVARQKKPWIIVDEIQKVPALLDEVHRLIESEQQKFVLTGSSARKLKRNAANLLAGRAFVFKLFPLTHQELGDRFELDEVLSYGSLPKVFSFTTHRDKVLFLKSYADTYLKEEIQAEAVVRNIQSFSRFLKMSALTNGKMLNFSTLSSDAGIPASTLREYYQILQDTLVGFLLPAWTKTVKRKAMSTSKFYFFDIGVAHELSSITKIEPHSDLYGQAFEHFIAMELRAYLSYTRKHLSLSYWAAKNGQEVDFIIGDSVAIEVKTTKSVSAKHLKGLKTLQEENICKRYFLISLDKVHRISDGIEIMYWEDFLNHLWDEKCF